MKAMEYKIYFLTVLSASCMKASGFTNTLSTSFLPIISNSIHASSSHILHSSANEEVDAYETSFGNPAYKYHRDPNDNMDHPLDVSTINHLLQKRSEYKKKSHFEKADSIRDYLQSQYGVSVNDKTRMWSTKWKIKSKKEKTFAFEQNKKKQYSKNSLNPSGNQQQGKGYQQVGGSLDSAPCQLTKQEIMSLLKERTKARRERNFQKSDAILHQLRMESVFVDDTLKLWRADGLPFSTNSKGSNSANPKTFIPYRISLDSRKISEEEEAYIQEKVDERVEAKINRDFYTADDIRDELRFLKHVEINDDERTWAVVEERERYFEQSLHDYEFGGKRNLNFPEEELLVITEKVRERMEARKQKDFDTADAILKELAVMYGVRVDDKKKLWHFDGSRAQFNAPRNEKNKTKKDSSKKNETPDWLIEDESIPDGITIPEDTIPDGISIVQESTPEDHKVQDQQSSAKSKMESLTVIALKQKLQESGLPTSGRKADLVERLLESKVEQSFPDGTEVPHGIEIPEGIEIPADENSDVKDEVMDEISSYSKSDLESLTVNTLKEKLRDAGLPVTGRKAELIDRLIE